jgi:hypothetical protein
MEQIKLFSLEKHDGPYATWPSSSCLFADGVDTRQKLPGFQIEAQYACNSGYLVITNYDCPHEERDEFILLNSSFETIARTWSHVHSPLIANHWPVSENALRLHYYDHSFQTLRIDSKSNSHQLHLEPFEDISSDARAMSSKDELKKRLGDLAAYLAKKQHGV